MDHQCNLDTLVTEPLSQNRVSHLLAFFGPNRIHIPLTPVHVKLFREILSPFYVFQIFSIILWMTAEYYYYASIILLFSAVSIILSAYSCRKNERRLRDKVQMAESVMVLRQNYDAPRVVPSTNLVPGDIICIPPQGCEMVADVLLLSGSCSVNEASLTGNLELIGESIPQKKSPITELPTNEDRKIDIRRLARHILFSGTRVLQARPSHMEPYVKAVVLRTGFLTVKGDLVRAILHPRPLDIDFTLDSFRFLSIMTVIAIAGSVYTWLILYHFKFSISTLVRKSLDILTIVVPPALPAVMTTGLYLAQTRLKKLEIFCINPSAINVAGTLNTVVFDKTGTLTEETISVKGVWRPELFYNSLDLTKVEVISNDSSPFAPALAACHSLSLDPISFEVVGDPLDRVIFTSTNWVFRDYDLEQYRRHFEHPLHGVVYNSTLDDGSPWSRLGIIRHFPFSSVAQRQSVVVETSGNGEMALLCKGAPEAIAAHCDAQTLPSNFEKALQHFTEQGYRVLALAWKPIEVDVGEGEVSALSMNREELECDLRFLGLVVLDNPLKLETGPTVRELLEADFRVIMATGDNLLTGVSVARQCGMIDNADVVVQVSLPASPDNLLDFEVLAAFSGGIDSEKSEWICASLKSLIQSDVAAAGTSETSSLINSGGIHSSPFSPTTNLHLVLTGTSWNYIRVNLPRFLPTVLSHGTVFSRFLPDDKTNLIRALQSYKGGEKCQRQNRVAMCGDGANDCGALKAAAVGIALSDCEASISAPFTSRQQNITCVSRVLKEGRSSLSTAIGSFKYMVLYSFIQFFTVLLLYYIGNTLTDPEYLAIDLFIVAPLSVTFAMSRPWKHLEPSTPPLRLLTPSNIMSVLTHLALSIGAQVIVFILVQKQPWWSPFQPSEDRLDSAGSYETTALFYFSSFQYVFVCTVLAKGPPFRENVYANVCFALNVLLVLGMVIGFVLFTPAFFVDWAHLLPLHFPKDVGFPRYSFTVALVVMAMLYFIMAWGVEKVIDVVTLRNANYAPGKHPSSRFADIFL
ncbi:unnamed protein product [Rodentolepis nana]|uniref:P-type ATPase A domain-containing protein n=1 Tax=Rodentolepis nana TaxID=102285 RepID=A0A3P7SKJ5_RODNA|nr:unnamed protein product [Rodentolepis nana]